MDTNCVYDAAKNTLIIYSVGPECKAELIFEGPVNAKQINEFVDNNGKTIRFGGEKITSIVGINSALAKLTKVTTIILPSTLIELGPNVFRGMTFLETINLGDTQIMDIGSECFKDCLRLNNCFEKINDNEEVLPLTLICIGDNCFYNCMDLGKGNVIGDIEERKTLHIPKSIIYIGKHGFRYAKYNKIVFDDFDNTFLARFDNNTFTSDTTTVNQKQYNATIKIVFYKGGPEFVSNMFIYNEDNGKGKGKLNGLLIILLSQL
jgi:hypothetical protein